MIWFIFSKCFNLNGFILVTDLNFIFLWFKLFNFNCFYFCFMLTVFVLFFNFQHFYDLNVLF